MSRFKAAILGATLLAGAAGVAVAQEPTYDPNQLPATQGKVAQYTLTPRGDVDGLILQDGTEVHVPPHLSTQLVFAIHPGDSITIHGLKARALPMIMAMSITNDATHTTVVSTGPRGRDGGNAMEATGRVKADLHGPRGDFNGVLLDDGTVVHLPPREAERGAAQLAVGQTLYVRGFGIANALGHVIEARAFGPSKDQVTTISAPRPGMGGWMHGLMRGIRGDGPPRGPGAPQGGPGAPPPPPPAPAPQ